MCSPHTYTSGLIVCLFLCHLCDPKYLHVHIYNVSHTCRIPPSVPAMHTYMYICSLPLNLSLICTHTHKHTHSLSLSSLPPSFTLPFSLSNYPYHMHMIQAMPLCLWMLLSTALVAPWKRIVSSSVSFVAPSAASPRTGSGRAGTSTRKLQRSSPSRMALLSAFLTMGSVLSMMLPVTALSCWRWVKLFV